MLFRAVETGTDLKKVVAHTFVSLDGGPRRVVAGPVGVVVAGVGEEVVLFCRPLQPFLVQSLRVAGRSRVEKVVLAAVGFLTSVQRPGD